MMMRLCLAVFASFLSMFHFGFMIGLLNAPQDIIEQFIKKTFKERYGITLDDEQVSTCYGAVNTMPLAGSLLGSLLGSLIADKYGRRAGLLMAQIPALMGTLLMGLVKTVSSYELLIAGRLLCGFSSSLFIVIAPVYVSEVSSIKWRGTAGAINASGLPIGLFTASFLGFSSVLGTEDNWPFLVSFPVLPSILQILILFALPESPHYLIKEKKEEELGLEAIRKFYRENQVQSFLDEMGSVGEVQSTFNLVTFLRKRQFWLPALVAASTHIGVVTSGVVALNYFSTSFFQQAGISCHYSQYATVILASVQVVMTFVAGPLMDRMGRRTMHLWGMGICIACNVCISIALNFVGHNDSNECSSLQSKSSNIDTIGLFLVGCTIVFYIGSSIGPDSVSWIITAELFDQGSKAAASSISIFSNTLFSLISGMLFPIFMLHIRQFAFLPFGIILQSFIFAFLFVYFPETKNHNPETIAKLFQIDNVWQRAIGMRSRCLLAEIELEQQRAK